MFKKYYSRVNAESILKSVFSGFIVGFAVNAVIALFTLWSGKTWLLILSIAVGLGVGGVASIIFYYKKYRPTTKDIARRLDKLGMEERIVTMVELESDESYIAMKQREDAKAQISRVSEKQIKFKFSKVMVSLIAVLGVAAVAMTTVSALATNGTIKPIDSVVNKDKYYKAVTYMAEEGGTIGGEELQIVELGKDATPVVAIPDEGWVFVGWDDGYELPERTDKNIQEDKEFAALFEPIGDGSESGQGDGEGGEPGEEGESGEEGEPSDAPAEEGDPNEGEGEGNSENLPPPEGEGDDSTGGGGDDSGKDGTIDGQTDYHTQTDAQGNAQGQIDGGGYTGGQGDTGSGYFQGLFG